MPAIAARTGSRVGFVVPCFYDGPEPYSPGIPFRSLPVATALERAGHEVVYFEQKRFGRPLNEGLPGFLEAIGGAPVVFIWQTDLTPMQQTAHTFEIARAVKERHPGVAVAAGGAFVHLCTPEVLAEETPVDYWIRGYGEEACVDLVDAILGRRGFDGISGLTWLNGGQRANDVHLRQRLKPEHVTFYETLDLEPYVQRGGIFGNEEKTLIVGSGRGCAKGCAFCYHAGQEPSLLPPETIVSIAARARRDHGVKQFHLAEFDFLTNRHRALALARLWRDALPDCRWYTLCSPIDAIRLTDAEWDVLAAGGCAKLEIGAEPGSKAMLDAIGKKHDPDDPYRIATRMLSHGITPMVNFIFGLLGEKETDRRASLGLIRRIHRLAPGRIHFTFRLFQPVWATPMGDAAIARTPGYPRRLSDVLTYRAGFGDESERAMMWLEPEDEARVKRMIFYYLPIAVSVPEIPSGWRHRLYVLLRAAARLRIALGYFGLGADRWLYRRCVSQALPTTYCA